MQGFIFVKVTTSVHGDAVEGSDHSEKSAGLAYSHADLGFGPQECAAPQKIINKLCC